jgi:hypothetical protein
MHKTDLVIVPVTLLAASLAHDRLGPHVPALNVTELVLLGLVTMGVLSVGRKLRAYWTRCPGEKS